MSLTQFTAEVVNGYCRTYKPELKVFTETVERAFFDSHTNPEALSLALCEAHRLGGAAFCLGFPGVGTIYQQVEDGLIAAARSVPDQRAIHLRSIERRLSALQRMAPSVTPEQSTLHLAGEARPAEAVQTSPDDALASQRILFADDDPNIRALALHSLRELNVNAVCLASSGQEALDACSSFNPTIVVSDWRMQPIDGLELLQKIRGRKTAISHSTPIIFLTVKRDARYVERVVRGEADEFLLKPFTSHSLHEALQRISRRIAQRSVLAA